MPTFAAPLPFREAVGRLGERSAVGAMLSSDSWRDVPLALRERAFFSAGIENLRFLQRAHFAINDFLTGARDPVTGALKTGSRAQFVDIMRAFALAEGMGPLDASVEGTLQDITSNKRLSLIFDTQTKAAADFGNWKQGMDPDVLNEFPAQRFIRVREVVTPRPDHEEHEGDVQLKTNLDYWIARNADFGVPWGPWGFNSGMDVEDVDRAEAIALKLMDEDAELQPAEDDFNARLEASTAGLDQPTLSALQRYFGSQVHISGDTIRWIGGQLRPPTAAPPPFTVAPAPMAIPAPQAAPAPAPAPSAAPSSVDPKSVGEMLVKLKLDDPAVAATADQMLALKAELRERKPVSLVGSLNVPISAGTFAQESAWMQNAAENFVAMLPKNLARYLPKIEMMTASRFALGGTFGDFNPATNVIRIMAGRTEAQITSTTWHELTHWVHIQGPKWYQDAITAHWSVRTAGEAAVRLRPYSAVGMRDQWDDAYAGSVPSLAGYTGLPLPPGVEVPTRYVQMLALEADELALKWNVATNRETLLEVLRIFFPEP